MQDDSLSTQQTIPPVVFTDITEDTVPHSEQTTHDSVRTSESDDTQRLDSEVADLGTPGILSLPSLDINNPLSLEAERPLTPDMLSEYQREMEQHQLDNDSPHQGEITTDQQERRVTESSHPPPHYESQSEYSEDIESIHSAVTSQQTVAVDTIALNNTTTDSDDVTLRNADNNSQYPSVTGKLRGRSII